MAFLFLVDFLLVEVVVVSSLESYFFVSGTRLGSQNPSLSYPVSQVVSFSGGVKLLMYFKLEVFGWIGMILKSCDFRTRDTAT